VFGTLRDTNDIVPSFRRSYQNRFLVERFGIEKQTVHIEDNRGWPMGELHIAWFTERG